MIHMASLLLFWNQRHTIDTYSEVQHAWYIHVHITIYTHCHYLHNLMTICSVIPRGSTITPQVFGWQKLHVCETQIVHNVCSDKCFIITLGEVGNDERGVGLVVYTLQVQLRWLNIPQVPAQSSECLLLQARTLPCIASLYSEVLTNMISKIQSCQTYADTCM